MPNEIRNLWPLLLAIVIVLLIALIVLQLPFASLVELSKIAPVITALVAFCAAIIAFSAILVQRDTAKRRAAIDFFLKTEMDSGLLDAYYDFKSKVPQISAIISTPALSQTDPDVRALEKWLNVCELIAVGVNSGAFSERVARDYWGYILPESFEDAQLFISFVRRSWGGPATFCDLEELSAKWRGEIG